MRLGRMFRALPLLFLAVSAGVWAMAQDAEEQRLVELTNEARAQAGLKPVVWDAQLAAAAQAHAEWMAREPEIAHQYQGEADLSARAARAGARFSVIAENIAQGRSAAQIHGAWMVSPAHHDNLMNTEIDRIGVGMVRARGAIYAVVDFSKGVAALAQGDVEAKVGALVRAKGVALSADRSGAQRYCALAEGDSGAGLGLKARFLMRWQTADLGTLPAELEKALAGGQFGLAEVGACAPKGSGSAAGGAVFSGYRVAVLLY